MGKDSFHEFVQELFAGLGQVQIKRMFGGAGGYADGVMFLLLDDETIYIKVDDALKRELAKEGSGPFVWAPQSGPRAGERIDLGYWRLPDAALDDPEEATRWGRKALGAAKAKAASKSKPKKTGSTKKAAKKK
ncbi:MAG TPA: TfoX/Sxy family protein [Caulobacterales bacterium]|nr:TfoX/Sxy family protein [Caulobacterales bacterium]